MTRKEQGKMVGDTYLTERECEALTLLAKGKQNSEISTEMGNSENSVGSLIKIIYRKIDVRNRASAGVAAAKAGLV